jgi:hypothetical protein
MGELVSELDFGFAASLIASDNSQLRATGAYDLLDGTMMWGFDMARELQTMNRVECHTPKRSEL